MYTAGKGRDISTRSLAFHGLAVKRSDLCCVIRDLPYRSIKLYIAIQLTKETLAYKCPSTNKMSGHSSIHQGFTDVNRPATGKLLIPMFGSVSVRAKGNQGSLDMDHLYLSISSPVLHRRNKSAQNYDVYTCAKSTVA